MYVCMYGPHLIIIKQVLEIGTAGVNQHHSTESTPCVEGERGREQNGRELFNSASQQTGLIYKLCGASGILFLEYQCSLVMP